MPNDPVIDNFDPASGADPLADPAVGEPAAPVVDGGTGDEPASGAEPTGEPQSQTTPQEPSQEVIPGTPFKNQEALIEGWKNIQRLVSSKDSEISILKRQLEQTAQFLQDFAGGGKKPSQAGPDSKYTKENIWQEFSKDPTAVMRSISEQVARELIDKQYGEKFNSWDSTLRGMQTESMVNKFIAGHPEFTAEDEDAVIKVLEQYPYLRQQPGGLEVAYNQVLADRYRAGETKQATTRAVADAKNIAGLGGKKSSLPRQQDTRDEFDDVLDQSKAEEELYKI